MSKNIWVTSDTHFGHENIIDYCGRPFSNVKEMDECLVENWNSVVKDGDKVYHLGDVYMGMQQNAMKALSKLKGQKRLILGNHDDGKGKLLHIHFKKIDVWRYFGEFGLLLTHVPVHESTLGKKVGINVHGHIHQNKSPDGPYRCVCVEQTNYTPINIEELRVK